MLKRLDPSIGGLRIGLAKFMDGTNVALVGKLGPLGIGRKVVGDLEPGAPVTLEMSSSMFENYSSGTSVQLEQTGKLTVFGWSDDVLGSGCKILREVSPNKVNNDPELRRFIHNPERGS